MRKKQEKMIAREKKKKAIQFTFDPVGLRNS